MSRETDIHCAKVYITEARRANFLGHHWWAATLLQWAANARRRAQAEPRQVALL